MREEIKKGNIVEFTKGGISFGLKGQVMQVYDVSPGLLVNLVPENHRVYWRSEDVKKL